MVSPRPYSPTANNEPMYLNCHTYYSLRYGTFSELDLLKLAQENHIRQLVLTDISNTSACLNFIRRAPEYDVRPLVGIDFRNGVTPAFIGIAANNQGFQELNEFLSDHLHNEKSFEAKAPAFENAFVVYPFETVLKEELFEFGDG